MSTNKKPVNKTGFHCSGGWIWTSNLRLWASRNFFYFKLAERRI